MVNRPGGVARVEAGIEVVLDLKSNDAMRDHGQR